MLNNIGILDSGIGSLTIARALSKSLPTVHINILMDTAHAPYGNKPQSLIQERIFKLSTDLINRGSQLIILACHTASALFPSLASELPVPVLDMTTPTLSSIPSHGSYALIGTPNTIHSNHYQRAVPRSPNHALACPNLATLAEQKFKGKEIQAYVTSELKTLQHKEIDSLILCCTHYSHLSTQISHALPTMRQIDPTQAQIRQAIRIIKEDS